jgi:phosphoribosylformylglycinamidine synthase
VSEPLHRALGLTDEEHGRVVETLEREPNTAELAMYAAMWSEHCSYKSSKVHLRELPTEGPHILVGPGEDAGVVDLGEGLACVFKMESHSHPSAIEPYQGAATGVGGIVRDVLSMGARPVAILDPLRFGPLEEPRNRWLMSGVVAGIGGYGNCIGIPTVGGEVKFADAHGANPTVNAMCVGFAPADRVIHAQAEVGAQLVLIGSRTGRDGIGGVSVLASRTLEEGSDEQRPSVQIGDPFAEKLLIEACLEMIESGLLAGLQDLGGAGITCAVSESAARAGTGAEIDLDAIPLREPGMEPFEILTSESQERMLAIVRPESFGPVKAVCEKWGLEHRVIGRATAGDDVLITSRGKVVAEVPARSLADEGPVYERPMSPPREQDDLLADDPADQPATVAERESLLRLLGSPNVASKRWVYEQYDSLVGGNTVAGPGSDAALIRIEGTRRAVAVSTDGNGRYGHLDPYLGGAHAVAESARNVACAGARPLAITNCLNFGNPERPEVMWAFRQTIEGVGEACRALGTPVTGGNVSFYNESGDSAIWPTPVVGMLGLMEDYDRRVGMAFTAGNAVYLLGETLPELGGSEYAEAILGTVSGRPPALDLDREAALIRLLVDGASEGVLASAHDCSDGGLAVALAESAMAGGCGFGLSLPDAELPPHVALFSESASRAVVSVEPERAEAFEALAARHEVPFARLGQTDGKVMVFEGLFELPVAEAREIYESAIPALMRRSSPAA